MPRPLRNNQPQEEVKRPPSLRRYAADKLRVSLDPELPRAPLDDAVRAEIDACAVVRTAVAAYAPQHSESLRAIYRAMLVARIKATTII